MGCCCSKNQSEIDMTTFSLYTPREQKLKPDFGTTVDSPLSTPTTSPKYFTETDFVTLGNFNPSPSKVRRRRNVFISTEEVKHLARPYVGEDSSQNDEDMLLTVLIDEEKIDGLYINYERVRSYSI